MTRSEMVSGGRATEQMTVLRYRPRKNREVDLAVIVLGIEICDHIEFRWRLAHSGHSVAFGCPTLASVIHTVRRSSSMQYQIRPPAVTSYCHCSMSLPLTARVPSELFRRCFVVSTRRGSAVMRSQATRAFADAAEQICSQPLTASQVANRKSQPSCDQLGTGTASPSASMGRRARRESA